ncbi:MAG: 4-(cytidine 5'-diphospho)-2-C-methyl-D-erythritol kinase [bacterium]|nr:4-(cytidine 5'-diphospho)-2-C-methyl-D-erythritol kinase [bacterium]
MKNIKIKCPAKINLTLEVLNRRADGFHNIKSVMQLISLYDFLNIEIGHANSNKIVLSGNSDEIPYDERNLVYKAADLYLKEVGINDCEIKIYIEKNIPISAGLAGGSTDAAGVLFGLNQLLKVFDEEKINELCAKLGSDLNVCLNGGCVLATSRGEITKSLPVAEKAVSLIKPKYLGISAKEAYTKYSEKSYKPQNNMTEKLIEALPSNNIEPFLYNDLEYAVFDDYIELQEIKKSYPNAIMSGSGSTYFVLEDIKQSKLNKDFLLINNLHFIKTGTETA